MVVMDEGCAANITMGFAFNMGGYMRMRSYPQAPCIFWYLKLPVYNICIALLHDADFLIPLTVINYPYTNKDETNFWI